MCCYELLLLRTFA
jgi:hypothetical protein